MAIQQGSNSAAALATQDIHEDTTVKWFPARRGMLLRSGRHHRIDHCGKIRVAAVSGLHLLFHVWPHEAAACQRHAVRLAARRRYGADLLPCAAALRGQAVEREVGSRDFDSLERHHPQCHRYSFRRLSKGAGIRGPAHAGCCPGGDCMDHVRNEHLHDDSEPQV
jgi:hypothetical protein